MSSALDLADAVDAECLAEALRPSLLRVSRRLRQEASRAGLSALRGGLASGTTETQTVAMEHFERALVDTRASVTPEMEREYEVIAANIKQDALALQPIGFVAPGMLTPHGPKGTG